MAAIDNCEPEVIRALEKDGWQLHQKPHFIRTPARNIYADFSIQRDAEELLILEVKCFLNPKEDLDNFYTAVGQYTFYRNGLLAQNDLTPLYLAVSATGYQRILADPIMQASLLDAKIKMVVVNLEMEEIVQWIP